MNEYPLNKKYPAFLNRLITIIFSSLLTLITFPTFAESNKSNPQNNLSKQCEGDWEEVAKSIMKNIPNYSNRVIQRGSIFSHSLNFLPTYIITVNQGKTTPSDFDLTSFPPIKYQPKEEIKQLFFSTKERQYSNSQQIIETENFHWLIFTDTPEGWRLVMAMTRFGYPSPQGFITSPPKDTTNGVIGQAVNLWLRDCQFQ